MDILLDNLKWMTENVLLAFTGVIFGWLYFYSQKKLFKILFFILWFLFIPNTIYLISDMQHFPGQLLKLRFEYQILLLAQYIVIFLLGIVTFLFGLYPLEKALFEKKQKKTKKTFTSIIILMNFLIAFAVFLGKVQRISSYQILTDPQKVFKTSLDLISTPNMIMVIFLFGLFANIVYFTWRKKLGNQKV